jgi:prenyltransferase beta subunit
LWTQIITCGTYKILKERDSNGIRLLNGEMDMRGVYCTLVIADILNIIDGKDGDAITKGMGDFIASC